jgi:hypothetical protein
MVLMRASDVHDSNGIAARTLSFRPSNKTISSSTTTPPSPRPILTYINTTVQYSTTGHFVLLLLFATIFACTVHLISSQCRESVDDLPNLILAPSTTQPHFLPVGPPHVWRFRAAYKREKRRATTPAEEKKKRRKTRDKTRGGE